MYKCRDIIRIRGKADIISLAPVYQLTNLISVFWVYTKLETVSITTAFPQTEYQRCIVHQVRNTLKYVPDKDRKAFSADLKTIYHAPNEKKGLENRDQVSAKWSEKYPNAMKSMGEELGFHHTCLQVFLRCP